MTKSGPFSFRQQVAATGNLETFSFQIPDVPIFLSVTKTYISAQNLNQTYVTVELSINGDVGMVLCQGCPNSNYGLSWPHQQPAIPLANIGNPEVVLGGGVGAGVEHTITIPSNQYWKYQMFRVQFVADATAVTRRPHLRLTTQSSAVYTFPSAGDITASQTWNLIWGVGLQNLVDSTGFFQTMPLPEGVIMKPAAVLAGVTTNIQAADAYSGMMHYMERFFFT